MSPIIEVQNLSKLYQIGAKEPYGSLLEEIMQAVTAPFRRYKSNISNLTPDIERWAGRGQKGIGVSCAGKLVSFQLEKPKI